MKDKDEIIFDNNSGISIDEQKEILLKINKITEKKRRSLTAGGKPVICAKKTGALFPLLFNAAAILILAGGSFFIYNFNSKKDVQIREGAAVYNLTEQALIKEIRKDTADKLAVKEKEINAIFSRLEDVDFQLSQLYSNNNDLTAEQRAAQERLLITQNTYRLELAALREDRSQILEDSRIKESKLRAQLDEKQMAYSELERLTNEQEKITAIDAQLAGGINNVSSLIKNSQYDEAGLAIKNLHLLINNSAFTSTRSFQSKKEFYNSALNSMEMMILPLHNSSGIDTGKEDANLQAKTSELEKKIAEMQKTIDSFGSGSSGQARRLGELESNIKTLESDKENLAHTVSLRDEKIKELELQKTEQANQIIQLNDQIAAIRRALQALSNE